MEGEKKENEEEEEEKGRKRGREKKKARSGYFILSVLLSTLEKRNHPLQVTSILPMLSMSESPAPMKTVTLYGTRNVLNVI